MKSTAATISLFAGLALCPTIHVPVYAQNNAVQTLIPPTLPPGATGDFHGYVSHSFTVDGCSAIIVEPKNPIPGRHWIWRTMFWDAYPALDIAMLAQGYYVAGVDVGNTYACPDALKHFDEFYDEMTQTCGLNNKVVLEGLSRGGLCAYRWGYQNPTRVAVLYADAPVCDMKLWPGGMGKKSPKNDGEWQQALNSYHFTDQQLIDFTGEPVDNLAPLAAHHVPIIHVCGNSNSYVPKEENSDIMRERYMALHGSFVEIVKQGCDHHPHGLSDPTLVVDYILAHSAGGELSAEAMKTAPRSGQVIVIPQGQW